MPDIFGRVIKPATEFIEDFARRVPEALGKGHHRIGQHIHEAADEFDKVEDDLAAKAGHHPHNFGEGHHDPAEVAGAGAAAASQARGAERAAADADRQAGRTAREGADDPERTGKPEKGRCQGGDPIDLVSGEMLLTERDVELPAILSLVLRRTHISSYRSGRWFGRSWASTLDERLEADGQGVVFATDDGMLLVYPVPAANRPVLPSHGPRWPLEWDGTPNSEIRITDPASGHTRHFSPPGQPSRAPFVLPLTAITDRNGNRVTIERTPDGAPFAVRHSCGYAVAVDCAQGRVTALRLIGQGDGDATELRRFEYDARGDLTAVVNGSGLGKSFEYDPRGRIVRWVDRVGSWYRFEYDDNDRCVRGTGADGFLDCAIAYDDADRTTSYTDSLGHTTVHRHNELLQRVAVIDPLGNTQRAEWDAFGRLVSSVDALGGASRFSYDEHGDLVDCTRSDGGVYRLEYNDLHLPVAVTDPAGDTWSYAFDPRGNRTGATDPTGARTRFGYDDQGRLTSVTDALGNVTAVRTNSAGLPIAITDPLGNTTTVERDAFGRVAAVTDPLGHLTRMGWTTDGCPAWREFADGAREEWEWDAEGNLLRHTDPAGNTSRHATTHFARESASTDPDGATLHFAYDTELRLTEVTNPEGRTWTYAYDAAGRLVGERDFDGRGLSYTYDAAGRLSTSTSDDDSVVGFERDALGRVVTQRFGPDQWTTFTYSSGGHLVGAVNRDVTLNREVNAVGRVLSETIDGATTTYAYDPTGNLVSRRLPSGVESTWTYDAAGRPAQLTAAGHTVAFGHDAAGREITRSLGDRIRLTQTWDEVDRLTAQALVPAGDPTAGPVPLRSYGYGADGLPRQITDTAVGTRRFDLDANGRVSTVRAEGWTATYAYDTAGNLTATTTDDPGTPPELRRTANEFTGTVIHRSGRTSYTHDVRGRLIRRTVRLLNGQRRVQTFAWDEADRLRETVTPGGERWRYTYDGLGRRVAKSRLDAEGTVLEDVRFSWDGARITERTASADGTGTTWDYAPASSRPVVQIDRGAGADRIYAVVTDLAGAPRELVTPDGDVAWRGTADLWGASRTARDPGAADCPLRFPGQYADAETGLNYNVHRYYDPATARYISPDPLGLAPAPNPVAYVDNPLTDSDPLGLAKHPHRDDATLLKHANMIHDAIKIGKPTPKDAEFAHKYMTVAVFADHHGNLYYTVNNNKTSEAQRQLAESLGYERINGTFYTSPMETDAEQIMLNAVDSGRIPDAGRLATSRPACDDIRPNGKPGQNCRDRVAKYPNVKLIE